MDKIAFKNACDKVVGEARIRSGIGTLSEKTTHAVLKHYYEPYEDNHEVKVGGFVADIVGENGVIEIQTRQFHKLIKKLDAFLEVCDVTIVYPVHVNSRITNIDIKTGEIISSRKSPKKLTPQIIFTEIYSLRYMLDNPRLHFKICMLEVEKQRYIKNPSVRRRRGEKIPCDTIPISILDEINIYSSYDLKKLLPTDLPSEFTSSDLKNNLKIPTSLSQIMLNVLNVVGIVERVGKTGNFFLYKIV